MLYLRLFYEFFKTGLFAIGGGLATFPFLSEMADYNLYVSANESLFRNGALSSRIGQLNMIDILYTAFANVDYDYSMERLYATHIDKPNYKNGGEDKEYAGSK